MLLNFFFGSWFCNYFWTSKISSLFIFFFWICSSKTPFMTLSWVGNYLKVFKLKFFRFLQNIIVKIFLISQHHVSHRFQNKFLSSQNFFYSFRLYMFLGHSKRDGCLLLFFVKNWIRKARSFKTTRVEHSNPSGLKWIAFTH